MNEARATRYQRLRRRGTTLAWVSAFAMLAMLALTPLAPWLEAWATGVAALSPGKLAPMVALVAFALAVVGLWELAVLPATLHVALGVDRAYLQGRPSRWSALGAELQAVIIGAPLAVLAGALVQVAIWLSVGWWWLVAAGLLSAGLVATMRLGPMVLGLFGTVRPLSRKSLVEAVTAVVDASRVPVSGVFEWGVGADARASALVAGLGRTRRVLLATELARTWSDDEVSVVVAHELAHYAHHDLFRAAILDTVILGCGLWTADAFVRLAGPSLDIGPLGALSALPAIALVTGLVWLMFTPARRWQSRRHERRADIFALRCTGHAEAFGAAVRRLGAERLVEDRPSRLTRWLFHRHPTVAERLALAEAFRQKTLTQPAPERAGRV
jgi:STE24 endopeptidase